MFRKTTKPKITKTECDNLLILFDALEKDTKIEMDSAALASLNFVICLFCICSPFIQNPRLACSSMAHVDAEGTFQSSGLAQKKKRF